MSRLPVLGCRVLDLHHWPPEARHLHHGSDQETDTAWHLRPHTCLKPKPPARESLWQSPGLPLCLSCHGAGRKAWFLTARAGLPDGEIFKQDKICR